MKTIIAIVLNNKILEVIEPRGRDINRNLPPGASIVDISGQPWLKVGDYHGPDSTKWVNPPAIEMQAEPCVIAIGADIRLKADAE